MAVKRVTQLDIININELYLTYKTKAEVARQTGFSASTIAKYIIPNYQSQSNTEYTLMEEKPFDSSLFLNPFWNSLIFLSAEEHEELLDMRKEVNV